MVESGTALRRYSLLAYLIIENTVSGGRVCSWWLPFRDLHVLAHCPTCSTDRETWCRRIVSAIFWEHIHWYSMHVSTVLLTVILRLIINIVGALDKIVHQFMAVLPPSSFPQILCVPHLLSYFLNFHCVPISLLRSPMSLCSPPLFLVPNSLCVPQLLS